MSVVPKVQPKFVVDADGRRTAVLLDIEDFKALLAALENFEDARELERAIAEGGDVISWEQAEKLLDAGGEA